MRSLLPLFLLSNRTPLIALASLVMASAHGSGAVDLGNIMPLGDSITQGTVPGGYRDPLYRKLTDAGYSFTFAGSSTVNPTATLAANGQTRHEGHSGYVIQGGAGRSGILENLDAWLGPGGADPQYILLMIGTNDMALNLSVAEAPDRLSALISRISDLSTGLKPEAHLIVAMITPIIDPVANSRVNSYNSAISDVVAAHQALGERVSLVDMYTPLLPISIYMADNLHPNQAGYERMADVWVEAITGVPEPGVWVAACGLLGLVSLRRYRRRT